MTVVDHTMSIREISEHFVLDVGGLDGDYPHCDTCGRQWPCPQDPIVVAVAVCDCGWGSKRRTIMTPEDYEPLETAWSDHCDDVFEKALSAGHAVLPCGCVPPCEGHRDDEP